MGGGGGGSLILMKIGGHYYRAGSVCRSIAAHVFPCAKLIVNVVGDWYDGINHAADRGIVGKSECF